MDTRRTHVVLPRELIAEIDATVGARGRSAFLAATARAELRRRKLLAFFENPEPAWHAGDHPELAGGVAAWVRSLREGNEQRPGRGSRSDRVPGGARGPNAKAVKSAERTVPRASLLSERRRAGR